MRLIDADTLMKAMYHRAFETDGDTMWQSGCWVRYKAIEQTVKAQPTIAQPEQLGMNLASLGTDCISRQQAIDAIGEVHPLDYNAQAIKTRIESLPSAQSERTCVNCGRTVNNGGWYADGGTRCPIEEHYALPKDGYCHLWEKRNVTDDDYPEGRADE